ncbi:MAG: molybdopterin-dependent oxidoreductase [Treponema sp.]|nr:molybdopterin-dependent oxidoreductase [Treponema sp.]
MPRNKKSNFDKSVRSLETEGFYSDYQTEDTLHAVLIRSPVSVGKIKKISITDLPDGYSFFTAEDIPGSKTIKINDTEISIFGFDNVSYSGEPLGIITGPDEAVLQELQEKVSIDFYVQSLETALENVIKKQTKKKNTENEKNPDFSNLVETLNEMPSLDTVIDKTHIESNVEEIVAIRIIKTGLYSELSETEADEKLFSEKDTISTNTWSYSLNAPTWMETAGAYSYLENDILHVYAPSRWTSMLMNMISNTLQIPIENIFIHKTNIPSMSSKGLWRSNILAAQIAIAAYLTKKPVKLEFSQHEQNKYICPGVKADFTFTTILSEDGIIKSNKLDINIDIGSSNPFAQEITDRLAIASCNYYTTENLYISAKAHKSKNPPTSINAKSVCSQAFFAIENQIHSLSQNSIFYPSEIRQLNAYTEKKDFPFHINIQESEQVTNNTLKISDFNRKYVCFDMDVKRRIEQKSNPFFALPLRGIGLATAYNNSGYYGSSYFSYNQKVKVTLTTDNKVLINTVTPSAEIQDIWKNTAAEILELDKENIFIDPVYKIDELPDSPEELSSSISNINEIVKKCCTDIQKRRFHEPLPLESQKSLTIKKEWDKETFTGNPFGTTSFAALALEVELDPYTFNATIKGIWVTIDCGEIFDEIAARRKIRLEIQQVISLLVHEGTLSCNNITINFVNSGNKSGQIGELIQNTLPAAFSTALSQALATQMTELPCTESQIYKLIKERENKKVSKTETEDYPVDVELIENKETEQKNGGIQE